MHWWNPPLSKIQLKVNGMYFPFTSGSQGIPFSNDPSYRKGRIFPLLSFPSLGFSYLVFPFFLLENLEEAFTSTI